MVCDSFVGGIKDFVAEYFLFLLALVNCMSISLG